MKRIAVLLTSFNRKEKTIECLEHLFQQEITSNIGIDVYLTDDGCTDGTPEAVKSKYPSVVIVKGDGTLFWNRGMFTSWQAAASTRDYDYYVWLNDDTNLFPNAMQILVNSSARAGTESIICGATCAKESEEVTYSALKKGQKWLIVPNGSLQECDIINGNFVLIPAKIYKTIGNLDWTFRHAIGDHDYGLRAIAAGFKCFVSPEYIGTCEKNPTRPKWCLTTTPIVKRFKVLYSPLGYAEPIPFFIYEKRHFGTPTAIKHFITINLKALIPQLWS